MDTIIGIASETPLIPAVIVDEETGDEVTAHYELSCLIREGDSDNSPVVYYKKIIKRGWTNLTQAQWESLPSDVREYLAAKRFVPQVFLSEAEVQRVRQEYTELAEARRQGRVSKILANAFPLRK